MDYQSLNNVEFALINHRLISCNTESRINPSEKEGGEVVYSIAFQVPNEPRIFKRNETFSIVINIEVTGKISGTEGVAFISNSKMEGVFQILSCSDSGVVIDDEYRLWTIPAGQLSPLVSEFITGMVRKMGYRNVKVPSYIPKAVLVPDEPVKKVKTKKVKKPTSSPL